MENNENLNIEEINQENLKNPEKTKKERVKEILLHFFHLDIFFNTINVFVLLAIFPLAFTSPIFDSFKYALSDFDITDIYFSKILPTMETPKETDVLLVNIGVPTSNGLTVIGNFTMGKLIQTINQNEPSVVGINHIIKKDKVNEVYNYFLANSLNETKNLVMACNLKKYNTEDGYFKKIETSDSMFIENATLAVNNLITGKDKKYSTIRDFYPKLPHLKQNLKRNSEENSDYEIEKKDLSYKYAFGLVLAQKFNPDAVKRLLERKNSKETISYIGNFNKFEVVDAVDIIEANIDISIIKNKIVILAPFDTSGISNELSRMYYTPLNERTAGRTFADMYEVFIHANIISMLLTDQYFDEMTETASIFYSFVICYINLALFKYIKNKNEKWFEISSLMIFSISSIAIAYFTVNSFYEYRFELKLTLAILASAVSLFVFEIYYDTVKPLVIRLFIYIYNTKLVQLIKNKLGFGSKNTINT